MYCHSLFLWDFIWKYFPSCSLHTFHPMTWRLTSSFIPHPSHHHFVASFDNGSQPTTPRPQLPKWQFHCETLRSGPARIRMSPVVKNFEKPALWWLRCALVLKGPRTFWLKNHGISRQSPVRLTTKKLTAQLFFVAQQCHQHMAVAQLDWPRGWWPFPFFYLPEIPLFWVYLK